MELSRTLQVKWFNGEKGFGFIAQPDGGPDIFVHQSDIYAPGFRSRLGTAGLKDGVNMRAKGGTGVLGLLNQMLSRGVVRHNAHAFHSTPAHRSGRDGCES